MVDLPRLDVCNDTSLKIRDQLGGVGIAAIRLVTHMLKQSLQYKQIAQGKRFVVAGRWHVVSRAYEGGKDFVRGAFTVLVEVGLE
jgi:hypothetical protein